MLKKKTKRKTRRTDGEKNIGEPQKTHPEENGCSGTQDPTFGNTR